MVSSWEELIAVVQPNEIYKLTRPNQCHWPYHDEDTGVSYVKVLSGMVVEIEEPGALGINAVHELKSGSGHGSLPIMKWFFEEEGFILEKVSRPEGMIFSYE